MYTRAGSVDVFELFWRFIQWLQIIVQPYEGALKLLSLVFGPFVTLIAFIISYYDKKSLYEEHRKLGELQAQIQRAEQAIADREEKLDRAQAIINSGEARIAKLNNNLRQITEGADELWKLKPAQAFREYREWLNEPKGARLITIGNLKGGVGKTTLAANLGAYISEVRQLPVLMVDLDFQGSLSNMVLTAAKIEDTESRIDDLLREDATLGTLVAREIHLANRLSRGWIIPANYDFARTENRILLHWITNESQLIDVRYRLAHLFLRPEVRRKYAAIIFDMPPRLAMGSINALVASHFFLVPTSFDKLSAPAVFNFITRMKALKSEMGLGLELAGIIGCLSQIEQLREPEAEVWKALQAAGEIWNPDQDFRLPRTIPRRAAIAEAAGEDFAVLDGAAAPLLTELCSQICDKIKLEDWQ